MRYSRSLLLLLIPSSAAWGGDAKSAVIADSGSDWEFSLSAGPAWRQSGTLGFTGGSRSAGINIPSFVGSDTLLVPPIGSDADIANRFYGDGFVRRDPSTGIDGFTTDWGYQNSSQVSGDDISFHATGFRSIRTDTRTLGNAPTVDRHEQGIAPVLDFSGTYQKEIRGFRPGFSASLTWSPVKMNRQWSDFSLSQVRDDFLDSYTDIYNLGGVGDEIPPAPYTGSSTVPGFVLENIPDAREFDSVHIGSEDAFLTNSVSTRFHADHTAISFGPTIERRLDDSWTLQGGLGASIHWLHWSAAQNETLTVKFGGKTRNFASWRDKSYGDEILGGVYLQIGADWQPKDRDWSIKSFLRKDFGATFSEKVGPSRVTYDVDGFTAAVMVSHAL
ncbi:MAG: hypothetical protein V4819_23825 [Verrucomicrobiota bacterium]